MLRLIVLSTFSLFHVHSFASTLHASSPLRSPQRTAAAVTGRPLFVLRRAVVSVSDDDANTATVVAAAPYALQVVTDIDDTVKSSGGWRAAGIPLGGIDEQYERGALYPGASRFALELSRRHLPEFSGCGGGGGGGGGAPLPVRRLAVLTARAREFAFALQLRDDDKVCAHYRFEGEAAGLPGWGIGEVLYGSVQEWVIQGRKLQRKQNNFRKLRAAHAAGIVANRVGAGAGALDDGSSGDAASNFTRSLAAAANFGSYRYLFIGDTGEADEAAAEAIVADLAAGGGGAANSRGSEGGGDGGGVIVGGMAAVFLHVVGDRASSAVAPAPALPPDRAVGGVPFVYFRTYAGAAVKALELGLLAPAAAAAVGAEAAAALARREERGGRSGGGASSGRWLDLDADLAALADARLQSRP